MVVEMVPLKGAISFKFGEDILDFWYILVFLVYPLHIPCNYPRLVRQHVIPQLAGKIPLIVLAEPGGLYATDPTFYGNQKQPLR